MNFRALRLSPGGFTIGQIRAAPLQGGGWAVHHVDDCADSPNLTFHHSPDEARDIAASDASGAFRPLKTAPNLKRGWCIHLRDDVALRAALDWFYPAALGFLGLGVQPPAPEWGAMISDGIPFLRQSPHLVFFPGMAIMLTVLGFNLLGDGLRDALDPQLRD